MVTRAEHLAGAKQRALEYADRGDAANAIASLRSDLSKHPDTAPSVSIVNDLMLPLMLAGHLDAPKLRTFIEGFN